MTTLLGLKSIQGVIASTAAPWFQTRDPKPRNMCIQANFNYAAGTGTLDAYVQTSLDGGLTATDVAHFQFVGASARKLINLSALTPITGTNQISGTDGALAANSSQDGIFGDLWRVKYAASGTYTGSGTASTTISIDVSTPTKLTPQLQ